MWALDRRRFLIETGALGAGVRLPPLQAVQARARSYAEQYPDMLLSHLAGKLNALAAAWDQRRDQLRTPDQIEERNRFVRAKVREMVHDFPPKTSLNPVVVATRDRRGYRMENVMFESRPGFWVTANLYLPTAGRPPYPGIISPCGHYPWARMEPEYQFAYLNLVLAGFVVLAYDPIGQGERRQYWNPKTNQTEVAPSSTYEHSMPGQLLLLMGEDLTHYRIWDAVRAIDYLESRPEVDPQRIGCAGHSGGGTLTLFVTVVEERIRCAVVNQGGTGHRWPVEIQPGTRVGPSDVEQNLFPAAVHGIDQCDLHVAIAPRPLLAMIENYSPRFDRAAEHIRRRYEQLGVPERFATEESTDPHSWTVKLRLATTDWFSRWFYQRRSPDREPEFEPEPPVNLYCTPNGSLRYSGRGNSIFSLIARKGAQLPPPRPMPANRAELESYRRTMREEILRLTRYQPAGGALEVRHLVTTPRKSYQVEKVEFLSEPGVYIPAWVFVPDGYRGPTRATLYVNEAGKQADGLESGLYEKLARQGRFLVAVDVRGVGETRPPHDPPGAPTTEFRHLFDVDTAMAYMAWYMDASLFGMRVADVVRSVDYVLSRPEADPAGVRLVGKGAGTLWALFAAALDARVLEAVLERGLLSYGTLTRVDRYLHGAGIFIRDVLDHFDLPQVAAALAPRRLTLVGPVDAMKRPVDPAEAQRTYTFTEEVYRRTGAAEAFRILGREEA
mgnify:CR=1 FL=1